MTDIALDEKAARAAYEAFGEGEYGFGPFADLPVEAKQRWQKVAGAVRASPSQVAGDVAEDEWGWITVRVEDSGDGLLINEEDAKKWGLAPDVPYRGYFLPDGKYRICLVAFLAPREEQTWQKPGERVAQGAPADEQSGETSHAASPAQGVSEAKLPATKTYVDRLIRIFRDHRTDDTSAVVLIDYARAALTADNEALRAKLAEAMEVVRPFADRCDDLFNDWCPDETPAWHLSEEDDPPSPVTVGDFRAARRLVEGGKNG